MKLFDRGAAFLFRQLPDSAQEAIGEEWLHKNRTKAQTLRRFHGLNVTSVRVAGSYGSVEGAPADEAILQVYGRTGKWATRTQEILDQFFREHDGGVYLDIGANIGLTTIPIAQNSKVSCIAFEPDPGNFAFLQRNIDYLCPHRNVEVKNIAIFSRPSVLKMELSLANFGDHRIRLKDDLSLADENKRSTVDVKAEALDDVVAPTKGNLAVKIDTQGAEPFVIEGGRRTLANAKLIISEFSPYHMARMGSASDVFIDFFRNFPEVTLVKGESGPQGDPMSGEQAAVLLARYYSESKMLPVGAYWDVIARRK